MVKSKVIVQFDVDGVLADFNKGFTTLANSMFGSPIKDTLTQLDWNTYEGLTEKQVNEVWRAIEKSWHFWERLDSLISDGTWQRIRDLMHEHRVYFVTARHTVGIDVELQTRWWFTKQGLYCPSLIYTADKAGFARAAGVTHSIEDNLKNAIGIGIGTPAKSHLIDRPYNKSGLPRPYGVSIRIQTVDQFLDRVQEDINEGHDDGRVAGDDRVWRNGCHVQGEASGMQAA